MIVSSVVSYSVPSPTLSHWPQLLYYVSRGYLENMAHMVAAEIVWGAGDVFKRCRWCNCGCWAFLCATRC